MPSNNGRAEPTVRDYSYVSCGLEMMYEDGGGGGDGGGGDDGGVDNRDDTDGNDSMSGGGGGGSNGSDLEDDSCSSWTEDTVSYAGTSTSDSSSSSSSSSNGIDDGNKTTIKGRGLTHGDGGGGGYKGKWLRTLWTIIDRVDRGDPNGKPRPVQPVKTILRPPTTYKYVIGMSGFPSKVAVYPRRM